jgi:hypothetical protein
MGDMPIMEPYFNWVKARSACSLKSVFLLLAEIVDSDVKAANELPEGRRFSLERQDRKLIVIRESRESPAAIVFELSATEIRVREAEKTLFVARPSLERDGKCRLEVDGDPLELWQVSRKALEELFFE